MKSWIPDDVQMATQSAAAPPGLFAASKLGLKLEIDKSSS